MRHFLLGIVGQAIAVSCLPSGVQPACSQPVLVRGTRATH